LSLLHDSLYETWQLARYCNNLRDISALESGAIEICLEPCSLKQAVDAAIGSVRLYADYQHKPCNFSVSMEDEFVHCDWSRLVHILDSVMLNAVIYSTAQVTLSISAQCDEEQVVLSIKDNGGGIDKDELARVFSPGFRGANAAEVHYNGMGMELHLARQMLIRMHGAIDIHSSKGVGTNVELSLARESRA
jgi:two-component system sensor histidine kinase VicK